MSTLISIPAGRCSRRSPDTKWIDPQPDKGSIEMRFEDELMHLWWKTRDSGTVEDELIIFPGEATFDRVQQDSSGRTHILKFSSSDQKYFFWFQRAAKETDLRSAVDINALLQDPSYRPGTAPLPEPTQPTTPVAPTQEERSWPPTPGAPRLSHPEPAPRSQPGPSTSSPAAAGSSEDMARMLVEWAQQGGLGSVGTEDARLTDVLSPTNISNLLSAHPTLIPTITPLLPPNINLPAETAAQDLMPILSAPQFTDAIASLDNALRSGGLPGGMMRELGLPEEAGRGVKEFLEGLKGLEKQDEGGAGRGDERMEQD